MKFLASFVLILALICLARGESGTCSWYGTASDYQGQPTAFGEPFNRFALTAAHKSLPKGTNIQVRNLNNDATVNVVINDRGPSLPGRILDLSAAAFSAVEDKDKGLFPCDYQIQ